MVKEKDKAKGKIVNFPLLHLDMLFLNKNCPM